MPPFTEISPLSGRSRPRISLRMVDFPEPLDPSKMRVVPRSTVNDTWSTATRAPNVLVTSRRASMVSRRPPRPARARSGMIPEPRSARHRVPALVGETALEVGAFQPSDQPAVGVRDQRVIDPGGVQRGGVEEPEHHTVIMEHHADVPASVAGPLRDVAHPLIQAAGRHVDVRDVPCPRLAREPAFAGQAGGEPVDLARCIAKDALEAERLEPHRGPRAQISVAVVAVDDGPAITAQAMRLGSEPAERNANGSRDVLVLVVMSREHLDELGPLFHEPLHVVATDLEGRHRD